jgi:hypothetical protein
MQDHAIKVGRNPPTIASDPATRADRSHSPLPGASSMSPAAIIINAGMFSGICLALMAGFALS